MNVIAGQNVDLIFPFPASEVGRIFGWSHCFKTLLDSDDLPVSQSDVTASAAATLSACPAWGIIDKRQLTTDRHEAPIVGVIFLEPQTVRAGWLHFAAGRKAFKMGLVDEAMELAVKTVFEDLSPLLRLGIYTADSNGPVKSLARRLGFSFERKADDMFVKKGEPQAVAYFGLTRRRYQELWTSQGSSRGSATEPISQDDQSGTPQTTLAEEPALSDSTTPSMIPTSSLSSKDDSGQEDWEAFTTSVNIPKGWEASQQDSAIA